MGRMAAIGAADRVRGFGLAGAIVCPAEDASAVLTAWQDLPADVEVVILTRTAADALGAAATEPAAPLVAVLPEGVP
jgi:vacuolar-type H+-ATPase subunit F/Vma7